MNSGEKDKKTEGHSIFRILIFVWIFIGIPVLPAVCGPVSVYGADFRAEDITEGSKVTFGKYEQDEEKSGKEALEWRVLEKDEAGNKALLITSDCIACMPYHSEKEEITWNDSALRQWLNGFFLQEAFSDEERSRILETDVETRVEEEIEEEGVITSRDRVFLLSDEEVKTYFKRKSDRLAGVSAVIRRQAEEESEEEAGEEESEGKGGEAEEETENETEKADSGLRPAVSELTDAIFWWLRTPGDTQDCVGCVGAEGSIVASGYLVIQTNFGVRPVIWIELDEEKE